MPLGSRDAFLYACAMSTFSSRAGRRAYRASIAASVKAVVLKYVGDESAPAPPVGFLKDVAAELEWNQSKLSRALNGRELGLWWLKTKRLIARRRRRAKNKRYYARLAKRRG